MTEQASSKPSTQSRKHAPTPHKGNSRAVIKQKVSIQTTPTQKTIDRHFGVISANLYQMCVMLPILTNTEIASRVETILEQYFEVAHSGIHSEIQRLQIILQQAGLETGDDLTFTRPDEKTYEITTPYASRFLRLGRDLDQMIMLIEAAFLGGEFTSVQRSTAIRHGTNRLSRLGGRIRNLDNSLKSLYTIGKDATLKDVREAGVDDKLEPETSEETVEEAPISKAA